MHRRPARRTTTLPIAAALLIAAALVAGCGLLPKEAEETPPPLQVPVTSVKEIFTVSRRDLEERISLRAYVAPRHEALLMFRQGGRIKRRHVEAGQLVKAGDLVAELETGSLAAQVELARIGFERAELRLRQVREKAETLKGGLDPYEEQFLSMDVRSARISLQSLEDQIADSRLYAPFGGLISEATGNPGEQVGAYQALITLQDPSTPVIKADLDEATSLKVAAGMRVSVQLHDLGDAALPGTVVAAPAAGVRTPIQIDLDQPRAGLKLGGLGRATVVLQAKKGVLVLPNAAVRNFTGRNYVVVVDGDSRREVDVALGIASETETEITMGLAEGQKVMGR